MVPFAAAGAAAMPIDRLFREGKIKPEESKDSTGPLRLH